MTGGVDGGQAGAKGAAGGTREHHDPGGGADILSIDLPAGVAADGVDQQLVPRVAERTPAVSRRRERARPCGWTYQVYQVETGVETVNLLLDARRG